MFRTGYFGTAVSLGFATLVLATTAQAETLQVAGLYPARAPDIASIKSIAIDRFGGNDGTALAFEIEDKLSDVEIDRAPYFKVMASRAAVDPEGILSGTANAAIDEYKTSDYRDFCIERNHMDICLKEERRKISCIKRVIDFQAQIRLSRFSDGRTVYSDRKSNRNEQTVCKKDENFASSEAIIRGMINSAAYSVRRDLAPTERRENIRVLESRKGMDRATADYFKAAVKMTKTDEREACRMWDQAAANSAPHISIAFNRGLCAEKAGALDRAMTHYLEAGQLSAGKTEVVQAIRRVENRQRARDDWDIRYADVPDADEVVPAAEVN